MMRPRNLYMVETVDTRTLPGVPRLEVMLMWSTLTVDEMLKQGDNVMLVTDVYVLINNQKDGKWLDHYMREEGLRR